MPDPSELVGQTLGHYCIREFVGAGGMGVVYRAHDERLDRDVAVKVLSPGSLANEVSRKHFRKEALALSRLNHPNIATVFDFNTQDGTDFLVTEYIPGANLDKSVGPAFLVGEQVIGIALQMAQGLAAAHDKGVIHRDLKPGNLRLTPDGRLKILDFGIAKIVAAGEREATQTLTEGLRFAGTLPYMAPEQLRGEQPDWRADIYAAGAVLYEMATGKRPFEQELPTALINDIINKSPTPPRQIHPELSPKFEKIVLKCLEKDREHRYQSAKELVVDLQRLESDSTAQATQIPANTQRRRWRILALVGVVGVCGFITLFTNVGGFKERLLRTRGSSIHSLAVLPLENLSHDPQQEYFADGMTDSLITDLSNIGTLRVASRISAMRYKGTHMALPEIARELSVDGVVEGSVMRSSNRVRITARLIQASTAQPLWAESYERDAGDVLRLQVEVAQAISQRVRVQFTPQKQTRLGFAPRVDPIAYEAFLHGRFYFDASSTQHGLEEAQSYFDEAIQKDPSFVLAYVGLADTYQLLGSFRFLPPQDAYRHAKEAIRKALELDPTLGEAHSSLANLSWRYEWDWPTAEREFRYALELNPKYVDGHEQLIWYLAWCGRSTEVREEVGKIRQLDPAYPFAWEEVSMYYHQRDYRGLIEVSRRLLASNPNHWSGHYNLAVGYEGMGRPLDAIPEYQKAVGLSAGDTDPTAGLAHAYAAAGRRTEAKKLLDELQRRSKTSYVSPYMIATVYAGLGEKDKAFEFLEKAYQDKSTDLPYFLKADLRMDSLRSDPRFQDLMRRVGLP